MHLRVRVVNIFLASCLLVYLIEHRFKLLNLDQYVQQQLSKDYLMTKNPQTQVQLEPLFEKVLTNMWKRYWHSVQFQTRYWQRFSRVKEVCERYHLGPEDELNKSELTGVESSEENLRMQKSSSLSPEKTLMHLSKYSLLYCWVHKVLRQKYGKTFTKSKGKL